LFPSQTADIQKERFISLRELVTEAELTDRIETRGYDKDFVEEAVKHKGEFGDWMAQTMWKYTASDSDRDLIELHHFYFKSVKEGNAPRVYKTVFNEATVGTKNLFATHGLLEFDHGQYPCVLGRREFSHRPILSSIGLSEEAYTDEINVKCQLDGLANRTDIVLKPPLIVPSTRVDAIRGTFAPGEILGINRPGEISWFPNPPFDNTPIEVVRLIQELLGRRYPLFSDAINAQLSQLYREQTGREVLNEVELMVEMTWQLMQQFEVDNDVARVVGNLQRPFHMNAIDIQGKYEITATIDTRMLDEDYVDNKLKHLQELLPFKESQFMFKLALEAVDPDAADAIEADQTSPDAQEKEKRQVRADMSQMLDGIEPDMPMMANHRLHLGEIQQQLQNNPLLLQRFQAQRDSMALLQNRIKFHTLQLQQKEQNPIIGKGLVTKAFQRGQAPELNYTTPQGAAA
jgi:hypothetical protein